MLTLRRQYNAEPGCAYRRWANSRWNISTAHLIAAGSAVLDERHHVLDIPKHGSMREQLKCERR